MAHDTKLKQSFTDVELNMWRYLARLRQQGFNTTMEPSCMPACNMLEYIRNMQIVNYTGKYDRATQFVPPSYWVLRDTIAENPAGLLPPRTPNNHVYVTNARDIDVHIIELGAARMNIDNTNYVGNAGVVHFRSAVQSVRYDAKTNDQKYLLLCRCDIYDVKSLWFTCGKLYDVSGEYDIRIQSRRVLHASDMFAKIVMDNVGKLVSLRPYAKHFVPHYHVGDVTDESA